MQREKERSGLKSSIILTPHMSLRTLDEEIQMLKMLSSCEGAGRRDDRRRVYSGQDRDEGLPFAVFLILAETNENEPH